MTKLGRPLGWRNVTRRFKAILKQVGVPEVRFHDARHTNATIALRQGIPAKLVQERLGHSDIKVTLGTYSHVTPGLGREAVDRLAAAFREPESAA